MSIEQLRSALPDHAKDIKLNLGTLAAEPCLNTQQRAGLFVACALASRHAATTRAIVAEFGPLLAPEALAAAKAAAAVMAMNNVYYRFTHMLGGDYANMPARLRMNVIARPGVDKADFELWCLAVSAINGCGLCVESHEKMVRGAGLTQEQVQAAVRIAAVVHAAAATLDGEDALEGGPAPIDRALENA